MTIIDLHHPTRVRVFEWADWTETTLADPILPYLLRWHGESIWRGYANGGFDLPAALQDGGGLHSTWTLWDAAGKRRQLYVQTDGDAAYVFVFSNFTPYTDAEGQHFGLHPDGGYKIARHSLDVTLRAVKAWAAHLSGRGAPVLVDLRRV